MTGELLKTKYQSIWDEFKSTDINSGTGKSNDRLLDRGFVFQFDEEEKNVDVLFIGINPSYNGVPEESKYYTKNQAIQHNYFKPFERIEDELKKKYKREITWTHIDLLVFRETKQKFIQSLIKTEHGLSFVCKQLELAHDILNYFNPKIIVVSNTQARTFLGADQFKNSKGIFENVWMNYDFEFDSNIGTYTILGNTINPFVFFTSMLSGQRALDNGSRERLVWHINEILYSSNI